MSKPDVETAKKLAPDLGSGRPLPTPPKHYPHVDRSGIPTATWAENGLDRLADGNLVAGVLGHEHVTTPLVLGVVEMLRSANADQLTSAVWWEALSAVNADCLEAGGYLGLADIPPALRLPA